nr:hypothetical protein [uncultured Methanoregula sp.]
MGPHHVPVKPVVLVLLLAAIFVTPAMAAGHWDIMTVENGSLSDNTDGLYTSIVMDRNNVPHAAWVNEAKDQVEYGTYKDTGWTIERVGPIDHMASGRTRTYYTFTTSIDLDPQGNPAISYAGIEGHLYFAHRETDGTWIITDVAGSDTQKHPWSSLKYDHTGRPHIAFTAKPYVADVPHLAILSWAWQKDDKSWQVDTIDDSVNKDVGYEPSLAFDSQNRAIVVYRKGYTLHDAYFEYLKIARQGESGSWEAFRPINSCGTYDSCGFHPSLALDSEDNAHFVHYTVSGQPKTKLSCTNRELEHVSIELSPNPWIQRWDVPPYHRDHWSLLPIDAWDSLAVDSADKTHVSFYDTLEKHLKYSYADGDPVTIDAGVHAGRCNAIAVDSGGNPWIIYHDDTNNAVKVARWLPE